MKKNEVQIGEVYSAKVGGNYTAVRVDRENPRGGWDGTNLKTGKPVRVRSAQRLRGKAAGWPGKPAAEAPAGVAETVAAIEQGDLGQGIVVPEASRQRRETARQKRAKAGRRGGQGGKEGTRAKPGGNGAKLGGLGAAARVLAEAGRPMKCEEIVQVALARGYWSTGGKTPAATVYAAMIREIAAKGEASRFRKVGRGKFELAAKKGA